MFELVPVDFELLEPLKMKAVMLPRVSFTSANAPVCSKRSTAPQSMLGELSHLVETRMEKPENPRPFVWATRKRQLLPMQLPLPEARWSDRFRTPLETAALSMASVRP